MTGARDRARLFIALDLPSEAKDFLAQTIAELKAVIPGGVRWVDPVGLHLTLKFLGDTDTALVEEILAVLRREGDRFNAGPFPLHLSGLGMFPNLLEARILWAGVGGDLRALSQLRRQVEQATASLGFSEEGRPFRPHLTLGRVQNRTGPDRCREISDAFAAEAAKATHRSACHSWQVNEIHLVRSVLTPQGAIYTSLGAAALL